MPVFYAAGLAVFQPRDRSVYAVVRDSQPLLRLAVSIEEDDPAALEATGALADMERL